MYEQDDAFAGHRPREWLARGASMTPVADMSTLLLAGPKRRGPAELDRPDPPRRKRARCALGRWVRLRPFRLLRRRRAHVVDGV